MQSGTYENGHNESIARLVREFGQANAGEIRRIYQEQRETLEGDARIRDFLPILTWREVRSILLDLYKKG